MVLYLNIIYLCDYLLLECINHNIHKTHVNNMFKDTSNIIWETSAAAKVTKSYYRCLPALERFYRETKCSLLK